MVSTGGSFDLYRGFSAKHWNLHGPPLNSVEVLLSLLLYAD